MNEKICRLCLQTANGNVQVIGEPVKNILKLNLNISEEAFMCINCANNFQVFLDLKSACICMKERALLLTDLNNDVDLDLVKVENTDNIKPVTSLKDEMRCSFCTKRTGEVFISLLESKENMFMVDMLEKYIPEVNLSHTEELLTCESCLNRTQRVFWFFKKCLDVEEKINKYIEIEGTNDEGKIELQDVQQFIFEPTLKSESIISELKETYNQILEDYTVKAEAEIKQEKAVVDLELSIKTAGVDIKSEYSDCASFQEPTADIKLDNDPLEIPPSKGEMRSYNTKYKGNIKHNTLIQKNSEDVAVHKCEMCTYETKYKKYLKRHKLSHKSPSEIRKFKCGMCSFETDRKDALAEHELTHKSPSEITMFKCELCKFETKRKRDIGRHLLHVHKKPSEMTIYKCEFCTYETKNKQYFMRHKLNHKSPSEVTMTKCKLCEFETKCKYSLKKHMLIHKNPSEVTLYKCDICTYGAKRKDRQRTQIMP